MLQDARKTWKSWTHDSLSYTLAGDLATGDVLGDTTAGTGIPMPGCDVDMIHYNAATASGTGTDITVHNVTSGESVTFTPDSASGSADVDLAFAGGDELAIEVAAVDGTTAGSDVALCVGYQKYRVSSTHHR